GAFGGSLSRGCRLGGRLRLRRSGRRRGLRLHILRIDRVVGTRGVVRCWTRASFSSLTLRRGRGDGFSRFFGFGLGLWRNGDLRQFDNVAAAALSFLGDRLLPGLIGRQHVSLAGSLFSACNAAITA